MRALKPMLTALDTRAARTPPKVADEFYLSGEWKALRLACLKRDRWRCVICGEPAVVADHVIGRRKWVAEGLPGSPDELENLRSLCRRDDNRLKEGPDGERRGSAGR